MKVDTYTKVVLTGILGCLVWLCVALTPIGSPMTAQLGPTSVVISGYTVGGSIKPLDHGLPVVVVGGAPVTAVAPARTTSPSPVNTLTSPVPASTAPAGTSQRCQATTQKGTQCSRNAKPGSNYCWQHVG